MKISTQRKAKNGVDDKYHRGRPRTEWMTNITEWTGMRYEDLVRLAQDREQWRVMTANLLQEYEHKE